MAIIPSSWGADYLKLTRVFSILLVVAAACADEAPHQPARASVPSVVETTEPPPTTKGQSTPTTTTTSPAKQLKLELTEVASGFDQPVLAISPPNDQRLFIVDQPGKIWVVEGNSVTEFINLESDVYFRGERGLLGLAFHPDFAANGRLFVNYTGAGGHTRIVELQANQDRTAANIASQQTLITIRQPASNHNGGMIGFGPDGYLWIATGDGGGSDDQYGHGQRADTLLAALLRVDVSVSGEARIPQSNPYAAGGGAPEVWAFGLRNPWRFAFDDRNIYIADVGQNSIEEVNRISIAASRGANFGWPILEGSSCFAGPCGSTGLVAPWIEYTHADGCSIIGGFVYRGSAIPKLDSHYFYGDYCTGLIRSAAPDGTVRHWPELSGNWSLTSFGQDAAGEMYVLGNNGRVYRITPA